MCFSGVFLYAPIRDTGLIVASAMSGPGLHHRDTECMAIHCTRDGPSAVRPVSVVFGGQSTRPGKRLQKTMENHHF